MRPRRDPPALFVRLDPEQPPVTILVAGSWEDEQRLRVVMESPAARRRILAAVERAPEELAERRAA